MPTGLLGKKSNWKIRIIVLRGKKTKNQGNETRQYVCLFGELGARRRAYHIYETGRYYPLDEYLNFPTKKLSYPLQDLIGQNSTEEDFRESVKLLNELLGLNLQGAQAKRTVEGLAPLVGGFYKNRWRPGPRRGKGGRKLLGFWK